MAAYARKCLIFVKAGNTKGITGIYKGLQVSHENKALYTIKNSIMALLSCATTHV